MKSFLHNAHPFLQVIVTLSSMFVIYFILLFVGLIIGLIITGRGLEEFYALLQQPVGPENIRYLKFLQTLQGIGMFLVPPFLVAWLIHPKPFDFLRLTKHPKLYSYIATGILLIMALPIINYMVKINALFHLPESFSGIESWMLEKEKAAEKLIGAFLKADNVGTFLFNLFMIAIIPAVGEELTFRGILQPVLSRWCKNQHWGVFITAIAFSAMHMQFYGFLPRFALGMLFGYLLIWSKSLWLPILAHFINNAFAVGVYYFWGQPGEKQLEEIGTSEETIITLMISIVGVGFLLYSIYRSEKLHHRLLGE